MIACLLLFAGAATAATYNVNSNADAPDANPGNGVCFAPGAGCTLRAAIMEANAHAGPDSIALPAGTFELTIAGDEENAGSTGDLDVLDDDELTIQGDGADATVIDGGGLDRVLQVLPTGVLVLRAVTVRGGESVLGGGIHNQGELTLEDCVVRANTTQGIGSGSGGGISNAGALVVERTVVGGNSAAFRGGGIHTASGGNTVVAESEITDNLSMQGGAISLDSGVLDVSRSALTRNRCLSSGGALFQIGGIALVRNTTISENSCSLGGGVFVASGAMGLSSVTVSANEAPGAGVGRGGGLHNVAGTVGLDNTLVADNTAATTGPDCAGSFSSSAGHNLVEDTGDCSLGGEDDGNIVGVDPELLPLGHYRGLTRTQALAAGSPAQAGADDTICPPTDQRGQVRPPGGCDIGAFQSPDRGSPVALDIDADVNGVLESDEPVVVAPRLLNVSGIPDGLSGLVEVFDGPGSSTLFQYQNPDPSAFYGNAPPLGEYSCLASDCFDVRVQADTPGLRPLRHWDVSLEELDGGLDDLPILWRLHVGQSFDDVPRGLTPADSYRFVEAIFHHALTEGCSAASFCPGDAVQRRQLAMILVRAMRGMYYLLGACAAGAEEFSDVDASDPFCPFVEQLFDDGITAGCGGGNFCPFGPVTLEQMALLLVKARLGAAFTPPACAAAPFVDVPAADPFCPWIQHLASEGIVTGCGGGKFCPEAPLSREQMAVWVARAFELDVFSIGL